jgi:putative transposase
VLFCDNGSEFTSQAMDLWAYQNGVQIDFSRPGKPTDNAFIESFNGTLRDECLNAHWFANLAAARQLIRKRLVTAVGVCPGGRDELGLGSNRCPLTE